LITAGAGFGIGDYYYYRKNPTLKIKTKRIYTTTTNFFKI